LKGGVTVRPMLLLGLPCTSAVIAVFDAEVAVFGVLTSPFCSRNPAHLYWAPE
jgi:hypothetical protein